MTAEPRTWPAHDSATPPEELLEGVEVIDDRFLDLIDPNATVEKHYTGCEWAEGPVYFPEGDYVLWSDIPNNRMLKFDAGNGETSVFREPCNNTNGHYRDHQGRLVSCEHPAKRVWRTERLRQRRIEYLIPLPRLREVEAVVHLLLLQRDPGLEGQIDHSGRLLRILTLLMACTELRRPHVKKTKTGAQGPVVIKNEWDECVR